MDGLQLLIDHPEVAAVDCGDCQKWVYDPKTWKKVTRGGQPVLRPGLPPCHTCPKKSPQHARQLILTTANRKTVQIYFEVRATAGKCLTDREAKDVTLKRNLSLVDRIIRREEMQGAMAGALLPLLPAIAIGTVTGGKP